MADIIDIDVFQTVTSVSFEIEPNTNIININKVTTSGYSGVPNLQEVTDEGANTTNGINIDTGDTYETGLYAISSGFGVKGESRETFGVYGTSPTAGVYGTSDSGYGVEGYSEAGIAVYGDSLDNIGLQGNSSSGTAIYASSENGTGLVAVSTEGVGVSAYSTTNIGLEVNGNGTIAIEANLGNLNDGLVINSGASSTGNPIVIDKNGVDKLVVNQQGELTATKLIKQGGTGLNALLDNGSTVALSAIGGATNLSPSQTATNFTINSDTGTDATIPLGNGTLAGATLNDYTTAEKNKLAAITGTNTGDQNLQSVTNLGASTSNPIIVGVTGASTGITSYTITGIGVNGISDSGIGIEGYATTGIGVQGYSEEGIGGSFETEGTTANIANFIKSGVIKASINNAGELTAQKLIKQGGFDYQFLKADGSVDNNIYLTSADLPSTLDLYATTTASDISGYTVLVRNIADTRYNTTAVNVSTGVITSVGQLVGSLITDANIISGNPGVFDFKTIGNISRTSGTGQAEFFFRIYKRNLAGTETLIAQSDYTLPVTNGGYVEFSATALWNDGIFLDTDRVVLKYYANRLTSPVGSDPTYQFQFGGTSPVRSSAAIPTSVMPNIYLRDLADVENVDALNNEILYWNDPASLWEHSLAENLVPLATSTQKGLVSTTTQTFAGDKTFTGTIGASNLSGTNTGDQDLSGLVVKNTAITGATNTKITYDSKGLVTSGTAATTADIADSTNKRYVTDANLTVIGNTSGTNTGDNATNTQYSGLATSKQDTLQSTVNIKSINGNSLLGSGDLVISGGGSSTQSPFTILANNSNVTAIPLQQVYKDIAEQTYGLSPSWAGTAPTTIVANTYQWQQVGSLVTVRVNLIYSTAGSITQAIIPLPTDMPTPFVTGALNNASDILYYGIGMFNALSTSVSNVNRVCFLRRNAANTGFEFAIIHSSAVSSRVISLTLQYFV